ncbi:MAG: YihY/virulence factor BrkB family protein [Geminicoccaceae bacterium]|nr:YihY/virulence factor BrkB family protein [Geminicoccaceae bacterium]
MLDASPSLPEPAPAEPGPAAPYPAALRRLRGLEPLRRLGRAFGRALHHLFFEDGLVVAGYVAFAALFALFPFLIVLLSIAGMLGQSEAARASIELGLELVPPEVAAVLRPVIAEILGGAPRGLLGLGIVVSLWFASSGLEAIRHVLDRAYRCPEPTHFLWARLQSLVLVVLVALAILIAMFALVGLPLVGRIAAWLGEHELFARDLWFWARYGLGLGMLFALTVTLHLVLPTVPLRLRDVLPGTLLSVASWALAAELYSAYLASLPASYSVTYGSLAGIIVTLFFFYISAAIFILGAQLNGALRAERERANGAGSEPCPAI